MIITDSTHFDPTDDLPYDDEGQHFVPSARYEGTSQDLHRYFKKFQIANPQIDNPAQLIQSAVQARWPGVDPRWYECGAQQAPGVHAMQSEARKQTMTDTNIQPIQPPALNHPPRPPNARTETPSESTRRRWARISDAAIDAARISGHADGVREGYAQGWRWGLACGLVAGIVLAGLCWGLWLSIHVPSAAPVAALVLR